METKLFLLRYALFDGSELRLVALNACGPPGPAVGTRVVGFRDIGSRMQAGVFELMRI